MDLARQTAEVPWYVVDHQKISKGPKDLMLI